MLGHHLQEFSQLLHLCSLDLSLKDLEFERIIAQKLLTIAPATNLSENDLLWLETLFVKRWEAHIDGKEDYTCRSNEVNNAWIFLAQQLANALQKPFLRILMPTIMSDIEFDFFDNLNKISDPKEIYLNEDNKTWHSVLGLYQNLTKEPGNLTHIDEAKEHKKRPLTLRELLRIRNKDSFEVEIFGKYNNFWDYLSKEIMPFWQQKGSLNHQLVSLLFDVIESQLQLGDDCVLTQTLAWVSFTTYLASCQVADINRFYSILIEYDGRKVSLLEILLDCFNPDTNLGKKLQAVSSWIHQMDRSLGERKKSVANSESVNKIGLFDIYCPHSLVDKLPFKASSQFSNMLLEAQNYLKSKKIVDLAFINQLTDLFSFSWSNVRDSNDAILSDVDEPLTVKDYFINKFNNTEPVGQLPENLLPDLLDIIKTYFENKDQIQNSKAFKQTLINFFNNLKTCTLEDVDYLYHLSIPYEGRHVSIFEILIDCLQGSLDLPMKLTELAKVVYQLDHSLVTNRYELDPLYQEMHAGSYFDIKQLRLMLNNLQGNSAGLNTKLLLLAEELAMSERVKCEHIDKIKEIYALRWQEIIDTEEDYTRLTTGKNAHWIRLAQSLASANLISKNYYKLLIPSLMHSKDFITDEFLTTHALNRYVLSENGEELIFIKNCVNHHKANGTFYNCNHFPAKPLSVKEKQRLLSLSASFGDYLKDIVDPPVSRKTIKKIAELVEGSLFPIGLILGNDYNATQLESAYKAYDSFLAYIHELSSDERENIFQQHILFHTKLLTFKQVIIGEVQDKEECIAVLGQFFIKLFVDYDPLTKFSSELEEKIDIETMRLKSARKVYSDYNHLSEEEAKRRILIIYTDLMTHSFKYVPFTGIPLYLWDCSNTVTLTGKELHQVLDNVISTTNFENARFAYAQLMESIVKPALADNGFITSLTRYNDTRLWLQTIGDDSLFKPHESIYFEPGAILQVLWSHCKATNPRTAAIIEPFLEQVIQTLVQDQSEHLKWIRINIKFTEFLKSLDEDLKIALLKKLRNFSTPLSNQDIVNQTKEFIIHRLSVQVAQDPSTKFRLFNKNREVNSIIYNTFRKQFSTELEELGAKNDLQMHEMFTTLGSIVKRLIGKFEMRLLTSYLEKVSYQIPNSLNRENNLNIMING